VKTARTVRPGGRWKRTHPTGHLASGLPELKATANQQQAAIRLRLSSDSTGVLVEVCDADPQPPAPKDLTEYGTPDPQEEGGRGLFLVATLSARWDWYLTQEPRGKVVWCELEVE